jgi:hypothetical protein
MVPVTSVKIKQVMWNPDKPALQMSMKTLDRSYTEETRCMEQVF